jgi:F-type H+-transporting ATPase subunit delta
MKLNKKTRTIVDVMKTFLSEGGSVKQLKQVVGEFDELIKQQQRENTITISSSVELGFVYKRKLEAILRKQTNKDVDFAYEVDPEVLGGLIIRHRDHVLDLSVQHSLNQLNQRLKG